VGDVKRVALATCAEALPLDGDMPPLLEACAGVGLDAAPVCWDDPAVRWGEYDAVVLRSTWDYVPRLPRFLLWADAVSQATRLFNRRDLVRWSTDKHYLADLGRAGVPVVPTAFVEPGDDSRRAVEAALAGQFGADTLAPPVEIVVKPAVGAGSRDALRLPRREAERARLHIERLLADGRSVLLQPFLPSVDDHGETAIVYIDGRVSHAIRKGPLLRPGAPAVEGLFAAEDILPREPSREEGRVAKAAFNAIAGETPLYARVDLLAGPDGEPRVLELELVEPSLFFECGAGSALRFAEALRDRLG
jgi:glutathione synthase/RimK-type ligase-like ATP-grasp enzyme